MLVRLTTVQDRSIWVNPAQVIFVEHNDEHQAQLFLAEGCEFQVKGSAAEVVNQLFPALPIV